MMTSSLPDTLPQFFHLGLPRTGTTTIRNVLKADPRIAVTAHKFFQTAAYLAEDYPPVAGEGKVAVHSDETMLRQSGNYVKMPLTLWRLRQKVPQAKIILTLREQRAWLLSRYRYGVGTGTLTLTFEQWLLSREGLDFISLGHYGMVYQAIAMYFPRENIHVLPFEWLRDDYTGFFQRLYQIIGLPPSIPEQELRKNASQSDARLACKRHCNRLAIFTKSAFTRPGPLLKVQAGLVDSLATVVCKLRGSSNQTEFTWPESKSCDAILADFARSNRELVELTGLDLGKNGYCLGEEASQRS